MKCPICGGEMVAGRVKVQTSTAGAVADWAGAILGGGGGANQHLYFHPDGGRSAEVVVEAEKAPAASHCPGCRAVLIPGPDSA